MKINKQEARERLATIVKKGENPSAEDKQFILDLCKALNVPEPTNKRCKSCWMDAALAVADALHTEEPAEEPAEGSTRKYVLKRGVNVVFGYPSGIRVNELTLTDELAEKIIARGFPKSYFDKCE